MSVRNGRLYGCPVELALDVLDGKWKTVILARIKQGPMRYRDLRKAMPDLSEKVLTQRLREMEESGLIERVDIDAASGYQVTALGRSLGAALESLYAWGDMYGRKTGVRYRPVVK